MHTLFNLPLTVVTELGAEKRCMSCGEYWPADAEFFDPKISSRDGLSPRCIACIKGKVWRLIGRIVLQVP
jgi:hypothetical protein